MLRLPDRFQVLLLVHVLEELLLLSAGSVLWWRLHIVHDGSGRHESLLLLVRCRHGLASYELLMLVLRQLTLVLVILVCGSSRHYVVKVQGRATVRLGHSR